METWKSHVIRKWPSVIVIPVVYMIKERTVLANHFRPIRYLIGSGILIFRYLVPLGLERYFRKIRVGRLATLHSTLEVDIQWDYLNPDVMRWIKPRTIFLRAGLLGFGPNMCECRNEHLNNLRWFVSGICDNNNLKINIVWNFEQLKIVFKRRYKALIFFILPKLRTGGPMPDSPYPKTTSIWWYGVIYALYPSSQHYTKLQNTYLKHIKYMTLK